MTLQEFRNLKFRQQVSLIPDAVFIDKREGTNYTALLYQLEGFYIEAIKHKKYQYIYKVESFDDTEKLAPYLKRISGISSLLLQFTFITECTTW